MIMMERWIHLTIPHNFLFFSATMKYTAALIGLCMIISGISAEQDAGTTDITTGNPAIILDIKNPRESETILTDVVPPNAWVVGEVRSPAPLRSIIISSNEGTTDCGNRPVFGCYVPVTKGLNRIIVTALDEAGNKVSGTRKFIVDSEGPIQLQRITVSGKVSAPDGHPIEGATVRLISDLPVFVKSGDDGSYRINNAYGYHQNISVEKNGYANVTKEITFTKNLNTLDFTLEPTTRSASGFGGVVCFGAIVGTILIFTFRKEATG
jgi:hypothetical protein